MGTSSGRKTVRGCGAPLFGDNFGRSVASGDFDRDGRADLVVGVRSVAGGSVQVLFGTATGLPARRNQMWSQHSPGVPGTGEDGDQFGAALAVGDFNGDGFADLAVGAPGETIGSSFNGVTMRVP